MPKNTTAANEPKDTEVSFNVVAPVESVKTEVTDPCWNCGTQLEDKVCPKCGFDKTLLHNLQLEEERVKEINQRG